MLFRGYYGDETPPAILFQIDAIQSVQSGYLVKFRAVNRGGATVEGLKITGELRDGESAVERRETTFNYVPSHSEQKGGLFFRKDPSRFELKLYAEGYEEP